MKRLLLAVVAWLLCASPAHAATWAIAGSGACHANNGHAQGGTGPFVAPASTTVDCTGADSYFCAISHYPGTMVGGDLKDTTGETFTCLTDQASASDANSRTTWCYKLAPTTSASEKWTITNNNGENFAGMACVGFSGSAGASATVTSTSSGATTSNPAAGSIGAAGNLVLAAEGGYASAISSIDSSFATIEINDYTGSQNMGIGIAWQNLAGGVAGSVNPTWTLGTSPSASQAYNISVTPSSGVGGATSHPCGPLRLLGVGCDDEGSR